MHAGRKKKHVEHVHTISTIFDMPVCLSTVHLPGALCNSCSDTRPPVLLHSGTHQLKPLITPPCYLLTPLRALASHALAPYGLGGERLERVPWPRRLRRQQPAFHRSSTTSTASMRRWAPWMRGGSLLITCFGSMRVLPRVCRCTRHTRTTSGPGRWLCRCTASVLQPPRSGRGSACKLQLAQRTLCVKQAARLVPSAKRATCLRVVALP